jgi:hypothetical protein
MLKYFENNSKSFIPKSIAKPLSDSNKSISSETDLNETDLSKSELYERNYTQNISTIDIEIESESDSSSGDEMIYNTDMNHPIESSTENSDNNSDENLSEPNFSTVEGLKRSQRARKAPNRLNLYLDTVFCLINCNDVLSLASIGPII